MISKLAGLGALLLALAGSASADTIVPSLQLRPLDGVITGAAGATVGWGFDLQNGSQWIYFTGIDLASTSSHFLDSSWVAWNCLICAQDFDRPGYGAIQPGALWGQDYDGVHGLVEYPIDLGAGDGINDSGSIILTYDILDNDPLLGGNVIDSGTICLDNAGPCTTNLPQYSLTVQPTVAAVPEPSTFGPLALALGGAYAAWRRRRA